MLSRRRRRRPTYGRRKKKKGNNRKGMLLGLAGVVGLGIAIKVQVGDDDAVALTTTPMTTEAPANPAAGKDESATPARKGPVPTQLSAAFARAAKDLDALCDLRTIVIEYPSSPQAQQARAFLAKERARGLTASRAAANGYADHQRKLAGMTRAYLSTLEPKTRRAMRAEAEALSAKVFRGRGKTSGQLLTAYTVKPGDMLSRIADRHKTSYRLIKRINGLNSDRIRVGQTLRIPRAGVDIVIYKRDFELVCMLGSLFVKAYDVATGKEGKTPEGQFVIGTKLVNPDWYAPDGKVYRYGTKENILGTRWLAFENTSEHQGFGIHGTAFPNSIGTEASMGCIRLRNHDVEELYDLVPPKSKVRVLQ